MWRSVKYEITIDFYEHDSDLADVFLQMRGWNTMSSQINFLGQKSPRVYPKISKSLIPTNPVQICAVQQDQHLGIYVFVRAVHTYKSGTPQR